MMMMMLMMCCRNVMEMHWHWLCGWPTHPSCFTSSVVMWTLLDCVLMLRTYLPSVCSMHSCCWLTRCRTDFIKQCLHSSAQVLMLTVLLVSIFADSAASHLSQCNLGNELIRWSLLSGFKLYSMYVITKHMLVEGRRWCR